MAEPLKRPSAAFADDDLAKAYKRVFIAGDGRLVLDDLMQCFMTNECSDGDHPWRHIGSQDVMRHIMATIGDNDGPK